MPQVLYIGTGTPWTNGAGFLIRQNLFLRALLETADLHLAMFNTNPTERPPFPCEFTPLPPAPRANPANIKRFLDDIFFDTPRMIRGYDMKPARQAVSALHPEQFDAVFAYRIDFAHFAGVLNHPRLILDIDDPEHLRRHRQIQATTHTDGDWRTRRDLEKLKRFEHNAAGGAKLAFVCQANDARGWPVTPIVVPNCIELVTNPQRREIEPRLLFVGSTTAGEQSPNADAVHFFLSEIWPKILKAAPQTKFQIVGAASDAIRRAALASPNVELTGFVQDLSEIYAQTSISIAPIRFGTGTRIKILEAFAHACPVISTPAGADGIDAIPGHDIELAPTPKDFASHCIRLLNDPQARQRLAQNGYTLAARLYDRKLQHQRLVTMLKEFIEGPR